MKNKFVVNLILLISVVIYGIISFYFILFFLENMFPSVASNGEKVMPIANILGSGFLSMVSSIWFLFFIRKKLKKDKV